DPHCSFCPYYTVVPVVPVIGDVVANVLLELRRALLFLATDPPSHDANVQQLVELGFLGYRQRVAVPTSLWAHVVLIERLPDAAPDSPFLSRRERESGGLGEHVAQVSRF